MPNIVVVGAGVAGLTSALLLSRNKNNHVAVVARHMPGDYDIEYTSPWAGADVLPMNPASESRWERRTWPELKRLATDVPEAGIHFQKTRVLRRETQSAGAPAPVRVSHAISEKDPWYRTLFDDYRVLGPAEVPQGYASGAEFTSACINPMLYLPWLVGECRKQGVVFRRAVLRHIAEAASYGGLRVAADGTTERPETGTATATPPPIVVNCTGVLACRLGGVMDAAVQPARGQTVVVRNELTPMLAVDRTGDDAHPDESLYNMMRASGGGTVIGGTYQLGNWAATPDPNTTTRLLARMVATHPQLQGRSVADLDVIRIGVGLRPYRAGGVRLVAERMTGPAGTGTDDDDDGFWVVHNYGHAGWGYQGSYGCAERVVELVEAVVTGRATSEPLGSSKSKL
ncbi:d-amino acid oxidase [Niveomyces insectorum RCEF 264]|uniref:D-amino acid oxidase n=1 Tax=Niveomyces insectorum RCEF 264 TaxID=1081102 RepID=A0A167YWJ5_9HYPO|nr:d-amino acid oxidase [Niveomyces insectorum RCEF 264]